MTPGETSPSPAPRGAGLGEVSLVQRRQGEPPVATRPAVAYPSDESYFTVGAAVDPSGMKNGVPENPVANDWTGVRETLPAASRVILTTRQIARLVDPLGTLNESSWVRRC